MKITKICVRLKTTYNLIIFAKPANSIRLHPNKFRLIFYLLLFMFFDNMKKIKNYVINYIKSVLKFINNFKGNMERLTRRFIINSLDNLNISKPIRYERYYINNNLRIQRKGEIYQKEILDNSNNIIEKVEITQNEFLKLKESSYSEIIRDSYLFLDNSSISIKEYLGKYSGLYRVEVSFNTEEEKNNYIPESWLGEEITFSPLAFDKYLSKLSSDEFKKELTKYLK